MLDALEIGVFRFAMEPDGPVNLPPHGKGGVFRAAFGRALRDLVCVVPRARCETCPVVRECAYQHIFAPVVSPDATALRKDKDPRRGYVLRPVLDGRSRYDRGDLFVFDFVLAGTLGTWLPFVMLPIRELAARGLGRQWGTFVLRSIAAVNPFAGASETIYHDSDATVKTSKLRVTGDDITTRAAALEDGTITMNFVTPASIRARDAGGRTMQVRQPGFHHVFKRLRDRVAALMEQYCGGAPKADYKGLGERAEEVKTVRRDLRWVDYRRTKYGGGVHDMSGFIGTMTVEGKLNEFLPWLVAGELLHVGENAAFGNGRYELAA
ncbi:MAG: CRISPR system precrRNA processing endoribonuclease RAMP protein Cas6 [Deltaproteobacteria bacterium]|nr:CRISPR system precrRNA processing endoribonuclease RAMP protein Cas6 [Deltaproteobacteria bacterium]